MLLEPGGEIRIGDGAPGVNFTGIRIYKTMSGFGFETYVEDVLRQYLGSDGNWHQSSAPITADDGVTAEQLALDFKNLLEGPNVWKGLNRFLAGIILSDGAVLRSSSFVSGMLGSGMEMFQDENGRWNLEIDKMRIRQSLAVMEVLFQQIRATNGSVWVTSTAKVKSFSKAK
jgi:hypothetical protein